MRSKAQSSGFSSQRSAYGARYFTVVQRAALSVNPNDAEPFGQRWPPEMGLSGFPSTSSNVPSSLTYASVPQPTAQYGQTLGTAFAFAMRPRNCFVRSDATFGKRPTRRRVRSMVVFIVGSRSVRESSLRVSLHRKERVFAPTAPGTATKPLLDRFQVNCGTTSVVRGEPTERDDTKTDAGRGRGGRGRRLDRPCDRFRVRAAGRGGSRLRPRRAGTRCIVGRGRNARAVHGGDRRRSAALVL